MDNETLQIYESEKALEVDSYLELIEGCLIPLISWLGLVGNSLSIMVLQSSVLDMKVKAFKYPPQNIVWCLSKIINVHHLQRSIKHLLTSLAVFDTLFLLFYFASFTLPAWSKYWKVCLTSQKGVQIIIMQDASHVDSFSNLGLKSLKHELQSKGSSPDLHILCNHDTTMIPFLKT